MPARLRQPPSDLDFNCTKSRRFLCETLMSRSSEAAFSTPPFRSFSLVDPNKPPPPVTYARRNLRSRLTLVCVRACEINRAHGVCVGLGLIFQGCHYELPDIKFASVDLPAVTVETPFAPSRHRAFRGFAIIISAGNVYWWPLNEYMTPTWAPIKFSLSNRRVGKINIAHIEFSR